MATEAQHSMPPQIPPGRQATFDLEGMTCASCVMRIEKGLKKVPGVLDAQVNLATEQAMVTYDPALTGIEQMVQKVEVVGYKALEKVQSAPNMLSDPATALTGEEERNQRKSAELLRKRNLLILGIVLTLPCRRFSACSS